MRTRTCRSRRDRRGPRRSGPSGTRSSGRARSHRAPLTPLTPLPDEEFDDEPEIPEYLIAERNRGRGTGARGRGGVRGGRAAYQSAIARERLVAAGAGAASTVTPMSASGHLGERRRHNGRAASRAAGGRDDRAAAGSSAPRSGSEWSEVPPELEEMLRAQLGQKAPTAGEAETVATRRHRRAERLR